MNISFIFCRVSFIIARPLGSPTHLSLQEMPPCLRRTGGASPGRAWCERADYAALPQPGRPPAICPAVAPRPRRQGAPSRLPFFLPPRSAQQHIPSDSFGGRSPERVAADALRSLFTFAAAKIVLAQLEGSGRGGLAAYDKGAYDALSAALLGWPAPPPPPPPPGPMRGASGEPGGAAAPRPPSPPPPPPPPSTPRPPVRGAVTGDAWLAGLARVHPAAARRVAEVREAYCAKDFEWDSAQRLAVEGTAQANLSLMRELLYESLAASGGAASGGGDLDGRE